MAEKKPTADSKLVGLLAQFDDPDSLMNACNEARETGYKKMDAYTPFPVHGIDEAIGIQRTWLPFIVFAVGFGALFIGLGLQFYTNGGTSGVSTDQTPVFPGYDFLISGKPRWSVPANIPVTFEIIVLSSAFATFFGMWIMNKLPMFSNPLHRISRFKRATNDKFFMMINDTDELFDRSSTEAQLRDWGAVAIEECRQDLTDNEFPKVVKLVGLLAAILLLIPPVMVFRAMGQTSRAPRLHFNPDMDWQHKYKAQSVGPNMGEELNPDYLLGNSRSAQGRLPGTVRWGALEEDTEFYQGIQSGSSSVTVTALGSQIHTSLQDEDHAETPGETSSESAADPAAQEPSGQEAAAGAAPAVAEPAWVAKFPEGVEVSEALLARGQARFNIYCTPCHGYSGNGDGLVNQRALALAASGKATWTAAKSLHDPLVKVQPVGRIFDTITNGRGTMGPYRSQITPEDRWAIVAYVQALQETGIQPPAPITEEAPKTETPAEEAPKTDE